MRKGLFERIKKKFSKRSNKKDVQEPIPQRYVDPTPPTKEEMDKQAKEFSKQKARAIRYLNIIEDEKRKLKERGETDYTWRHRHNIDNATVHYFHHIRLDGRKMNIVNDKIRKMAKDLDERYVRALKYHPADPFFEDNRPHPPRYYH